jgi:hypothetical protein
VVAAAGGTTVEVAGTKMNESAPQPLLSLADEIGKAWAYERASTLRASERDVVGAWPGTLREALARVLAHMPAARTKPGLDPETMQSLTRATYAAARRSWMSISEPDPEP